MYINYKYKIFQSNHEVERGQSRTKALKGRVIFDMKLFAFIYIYRSDELNIKGTSRLGLKPFVSDRETGWKHQVTERE